jgi:hypothetical protein
MNKQFTCNCNAYKFPHRFGSGKCTGAFIAQETWERNYGGGICSSCNSFNEQERRCEVVDGQESIKECEAWQEFVEFNEIKVYN